MAVKKKSKPKFEYKKRTAEQVQERVNAAASGGRDSYLSDKIKFFKPTVGDNTIRILPPTWEDADHYGYDVWLHYNIGADNNAYLCPEKMKGKKCPVCEEMRRARADGNEKYEKDLKPSRRVLIYLIDRDKEKEGIKAWCMANSIDRDLTQLTRDKRTGEVYAIDDPEEGFDVEFTREGTGLTTKYQALKIARRSTELDNDEALEFAVDLPLPEALQFYDYDHIKAEFTGGTDEDEDEDEPPKKSKSRKSSRDEDEDEDEPPKKAKSKKPPKDEDDDEDEDEDEDDEPPKKSKSKKPPKDEDEDEDEEDEDEEPPKKSKSKKPPKDEEDDEDDDDEDEPPKKSKSKPSKKKKSSIEDITYEAVSDMDGDELMNLVEENSELSDDIDLDDFEEEDELREAIIKTLKLKPAKSSDRKSRLQGLRK